MTLVAAQLKALNLINWETVVIFQCADHPSISKCIYTKNRKTSNKVIKAHVPQYLFVALGEGVN